LIISHKHKFIFIKSIKTASSSTEAALLAYLKNPEDPDFIEEYPAFKGRQLEHSFGSRTGKHGYTSEVRPHLRPNQIIEIMGGEKFDEYSKIVNIRNPYDQLVSLFWWATWFRNSQRLESISKASLGLQRIYFLRWMVRNTGWILRSRTRNFVRDETGRVFPALYIRYEHLQSDVEAVFARIGLPENPTLPTFKGDIRASKLPYQSFYSLPTRLLARALLGWEIRTFGYKFDR